jgi:hypothetical protein
VVIEYGRGRKLMGCNCGRTKAVNARDPLDVMGGYKYLKPHQIKARLEVFKRTNCPNCGQRYTCDYTIYLNCKGKAPAGGR